MMWRDDRRFICDHCHCNKNQLLVLDFFPRFVNVKNTEALSSKNESLVIFAQSFTHEMLIYLLKIPLFSITFVCNKFTGYISKCVEQLLWQWVTYMWLGHTKPSIVLAKYLFRFVHWKYSRSKLFKDAWSDFSEWRFLF